MIKITLDSFNSWNQDMINAFYKFCYDRRVLPKLSSDKKLRLIGPINNVLQAKVKYQLMSMLVEEKRHSPTRKNPSLPICYNIFLSYCQEDSKIVHHLSEHLMNEGFSIWIGQLGSDDAFSQINKSECIVFCLSKHFFENQFSYNTVEYAKQLNKQIIYIKTQHCPSNDWLLPTFISNEFYFQFFGSEDHFNLEYDKLLLKLVSIKQLFIYPLTFYSFLVTTY